MRRIYLIRHARPALRGRRICIGSTDIPLGTLGKLQSVLLAEHMKANPVTRVFCSDLSRSVQTARYLSSEVLVIPGLREMHAGDWDGLDFDYIRQKWPDIYEKRGADPNCPIPGAEDMAAVQARFLAAVQEALAQSRGDIAIVAHNTVNQSLICHARGIEPTLGRQFKLDYGAVTVLLYNGQFYVERMNVLPHPKMDRQLCEKLLIAADTPERAVLHCRAVEERAVKIARILLNAGVELDLNRVSSAAMLHDIARAQHDHATRGADWIRQLGYPEIAEIIESHHDFDGDGIDECAVVCLADKLTQGTAPVTLEERFAASRKKCVDADAIAAHERQYKQAIKIRNAIGAICGKEVVL